MVIEILKGSMEGLLVDNGRIAFGCEIGAEEGLLDGRTCGCCVFVGMIEETTVNLVVGREDNC